jgi:hypothetical protein
MMKIMSFRLAERKSFCVGLIAELSGFETRTQDTLKFPLMSMAGQAEGQACADLGEKTPIGMNRNVFYLSLSNEMY